MKQYNHLTKVTLWVIFDYKLIIYFICKCKAKL